MFKLQGNNLCKKKHTFLAVFLEVSFRHISQIKLQLAWLNQWKLKYEQFKHKLFYGFDNLQKKKKPQKF